MVRAFSGSLLYLVKGPRGLYLAFPLADDGSCAYVC